MTLSGLASVCFALLLACPNRLVAGVKPTYDETRWTKVEWSKWKLPFPHGLGTGDTSPLLAAYPELSEVEQSSLDGPYGRSIPEELANSALMLGLEGFDDEDMIPAAAAALQCVTCHAMVTTAWQRMATDVLSLAFHALDSKEWKDISDGRRQRVYMRDACRREVTRAVLMRNSIAKIEGSTQSGQDLIFVVIRSRQAAASSSTPMQESPSGFSSSQGTKGSVSGSSNANSDGSDSVDSKSGGSSERGGDSPPTYAEKAAVQMACKKLLQEPAGTAVADAIAAEALKFKHQVLTLLHDHGMLGAPEDPEARESRGEIAASDAEDEENDHLSEEETDDLKEREAQASALLRRLVIEARPDGLHVRARRWEEEEGEEYEDEDARCVDLHPMCETWADEGECEANPGYMIGTATHPGHCLRACAMCSTLPTSDRVGELKGEDLGGDDTIDPSFLAQLQAILNLRTMALKSEACVKGSKSCISAHSTTSRGAGLVLGGSGLSGSSTQDSLQERAAGGLAKAEGVQVAEQTVKPGGFVLGKPSWGHPLLVRLSQREQRMLLMQRSARAHQQQYKELLGQQAGKGGSRQSGRFGKEAGAGGQDGERGSSGGRDGGEIVDEQEQQRQQQEALELGKRVDEVLQKEFGDKYVLLPTEFFIFEYLYKNHTRHYHEEKGKKGELSLITEDWMLGTFESEHLPAEVDKMGLPKQVLQERDLLPLTNGNSMRTHLWPYVRQVYAQGHECVLAGGRREVRSTEVRIACSPDRRLHILVREPDFCSYIFVLYSPAMCELGMFQPIPVA